MAETLQLPGFVNAHSHGFQRALRGRNEGEDFWAWRESMLDLARVSDTGTCPQGLRWSLPGDARTPGYTAVGEFHYLGLAEAHAAAEAATEAGVEVVLLYAETLAAPGGSSSLFQNMVLKQESSGARGHSLK